MSGSNQSEKPHSKPTKAYLHISKQERADPPTEHALASGPRFRPQTHPIIIPEDGKSDTPGISILSSPKINTGISMPDLERKDGVSTDAKQSSPKPERKNTSKLKEESRVRKSSQRAQLGQEKPSRAWAMTADGPHHNVEDYHCET